MVQNKTLKELQKFISEKISGTEFSWTTFDGTVTNVISIDNDSILRVNGTPVGSTYTLPAATTAALGGVIIGSGLSVVTTPGPTQGTLSIDPNFVKDYLLDVEYATVDDASNDGAFLKITTKDGTVTYVDISDLIDVYTGGSAGDIAVTVNPSTNVINGTIKDGFVTESKLDSDLKEKISKAKTFYVDETIEAFDDPTGSVTLEADDDCVCFNIEYVIFRSGVSKIERGTIKTMINNFIQTDV